jgi:tRNA pseudouridine38-40 synthase
MTRTWEPFRLSEALNYHLKPLPVAIVSCAAVSDDWHARFSAVERRYLYRIVQRRAPLVHDIGQAWRVNTRLDLTAMRTAAADLIGQHDFTTFRSTMCQAKSPVKTMDQITLNQIGYPGGHEIRFALRARSFLHNQVRSIVGTLERVGTGSWAPGDVKKALLARDRAACGPVAPPDGLYLTGVSYASDPFVET